MRFLRAKCQLSEREITIALFAKNKGGGGGCKQKQVKIAQMAKRTLFRDFY